MLHYSLQGAIASRVEEIIRKQTACDFELTADTDLLNDLAIDSLELVEMGLTLEKQFGKKLPIGELRRCITIGELVQLVESVIQETITALVTQETVVAAASVEPVHVSESRSEISGSLPRRPAHPKAWDVVYGYMNNLVKGCISYISQFFVGNHDLPQSGNQPQANHVQS